MPVRSSAAARAEAQRLDSIGDALRAAPPEVQNAILSTALAYAETGVRVSRPEMMGVLDVAANRQAMTGQPLMDVLSATGQFNPFSGPMFGTTPRGSPHARAAVAEIADAMLNGRPVNDNIVDRSKFSVALDQAGMFQQGVGRGITGNAGYFSATHPGRAMRPAQVALHNELGKPGGVRLGSTTVYGPAAGQLVRGVPDRFGGFDRNKAVADLNGQLRAITQEETFLAAHPPLTAPAPPSMPAVAARTPQEDEASFLGAHPPAAFDGLPEGIPVASALPQMDGTTFDSIFGTSPNAATALTSATAPGSFDVPSAPAIADPMLSIGAPVGYGSLATPRSSVAEYEAQLPRSLDWDMAAVSAYERGLPVSLPDSIGYGAVDLGQLGVSTTAALAGDVGYGAVDLGQMGVGSIPGLTGAVGYGDVDMGQFGVGSIPGLMGPVGYGAADLGQFGIGSSPALSGDVGYGDADLGQFGVASSSHPLDLTNEQIQAYDDALPAYNQPAPEQYGPPVASMDFGLARPDLPGPLTGFNGNLPSTNDNQATRGGLSYEQAVDLAARGVDAVAVTQELASGQPLTFDRAVELAARGVDVVSATASPAVSTLAATQYEAGLADLAPYTTGGTLEEGDFRTGGSFGANMPPNLGMATAAPPGPLVGLDAAPPRSAGLSFDQAVDLASRGVNAVEVANGLSRGPLTFDRAVELAALGVDVVAVTNTAANTNTPNLGLEAPALPSPLTGLDVHGPLVPGRDPAAVARAGQPSQGWSNVGSALSGAWDVARDVFSPPGTSPATGHPRGSWADTMALADLAEDLTPSSWEGQRAPSPAPAAPAPAPSLPSMTLADFGLGYDAFGNPTGMGPSMTPGTVGIGSIGRTLGGLVDQARQNWSDVVTGTSINPNIMAETGRTVQAPTPSGVGTPTNATGRTGALATATPANHPGALAEQAAIEQRALPAAPPVVADLTRPERPATAPASVGLTAPAVPSAPKVQDQLPSIPATITVDRDVTKTVDKTVTSPNPAYGAAQSAYDRAVAGLNEAKKAAEAMATPATPAYRDEGVRAHQAAALAAQTAPQQQAAMAAAQAAFDKAKAALSATPKTVTTTVPQQVTTTVQQQIPNPALKTAPAAVAAPKPAAVAAPKPAPAAVAAPAPKPVPAAVVTAPPAPQMAPAPPQVAPPSVPSLSPQQMAAGSLFGMKDPNVIGASFTDKGMANYGAKDSYNYSPNLATPDQMTGGFNPFSAASAAVSEFNPVSAAMFGYQGPLTGSLKSGWDSVVSGVRDFVGSAPTTGTPQASLPSGVNTSYASFAAPAASNPFSGGQDFALSDGSMFSNSGYSAGGSLSDAIAAGQAAYGGFSDALGSMISGGAQDAFGGGFGGPLGGPMGGMNGGLGGPLGGYGSGPGMGAANNDNPFGGADHGFGGGPIW